jgi:RecA-family ATPase
MSISPKRRDKEIEETAAWLAQTRGGEIADWVEKLTPVGKPFDEKFLTKARYKFVKSYDYSSPDGHLLYQVRRYQHRYVKGEKKFVQLHRDPDNNEWLNGAGPVKVVYRWPDLVARPDADVYFTEGEKDADRLTELGLLATTVAGQNWSSAAAEALRDRNVHVLEDNDEDGRSNSEAAAEALAGIAKSVRIVRLPGLKHKGDVSDWLDAGHTVEEVVEVASSAPTLALIPLFNLSKLDSAPVPQQEWSVEDRIPIGHTSLFTGEGAAGKSLIQLQLSVAHVLGKEWLGVTPRQGPALFVDAEDDEKVIHKRLADILHHYNALFANVHKNLHIASLSGMDSVLGVLSRKSGKIEPTPLYNRLLEMVGDLKPVMTGIASAANVFAGNEIDRSQVQQFVALLTRLAKLANGSLVLISHPSLAGISTDSGISGSTQWHNSVRSRFYLKSVKSEDEEEPEGNRRPESNLRVIEFRKNNYGPISEDMVIEYKNGVFLPVIGTSVDQVERNQRADDVYLSVLQRLTSQNQELGLSKHASNYAPTRIAEHPDVAGFRRREIEAAQQRLLDANRIHVEENGPPSKKRKFLVIGAGTEPAF